MRQFRQFSFLPSHIFLGLVIVALPLNLFLKLGPLDSAYVRGYLSDYLIVKLTLVEIISWGGYLGWLLWQRLWLKPPPPTQTSGLAMGALTVFFAVQILSTHPVLSLWLGLRLLLAAWFGWWLFHRPHLLSQISLWLVTQFTLLFQVGIASYQFWWQKPVFPYFVLGETQLNRGWGLAHHSFNGIDRILSYGTTAHPNILAFLVVGYWWWGWQWWLNWGSKPWQKIIISLSTGCLLLGLYYTQSLTAILFLCCLLLYQRFKKSLNQLSFTQLCLLNLIVSGIFLLSLLVFQTFITTPSINRRFYLAQAGWHMWQAHPILGVGLGNFTSLVEKYSSTREVVRFLQPVHHVGLLWLSETGLAGILIGVILLGTLGTTWKRAVLIIGLLSIGPLSWDHFLLTNHSSLFFVAFVLGSNSLWIKPVLTKGSEIQQETA